MPFICILIALEKKLDNIRINPKVGFEVDQHICFLPSYYFHPCDASQADTLYISVVIKGRAEIIEDCEEKAFALNMLMRKYQNRDRYQELNPLMPSVREVAVIRISPHEIHGKYKNRSTMGTSVQAKNCQSYR